MSQRRQNVIVFSPLRPNSRISVLDTVKFRMLPAPLSSSSARWPAISVKARSLQEQQPSAAALIEELLDDLLSEVS